MQFILSLIAYFSTTALGSPLYLLIHFLVGLYLLSANINRNLLVFLAVLLVFGFSQYVIGLLFGNILSSNVSSVGFEIPLALAIAMCVVASRCIESKFIHYFILFVVFEVCIGFVESYLGIRSILGVEFKGETEIGAVDELYFNRVFGLSLNSSAFAIKMVLAGVAICHLKKIGLINNLHYFALLFIASGFWINFTRSAVIAYAFVVLIFILLHGLKYLLLTAIPAFFLLLGGLPMVINELSKGEGYLDFSGRDYVFLGFLDFISNNLLFGNYGLKLYLDFSGSSYHAHNSYLQILSTTGLLFSLIIFHVVFRGLLRNRIVYLLPILFISLFQYVIFWGLSLYDMFLWYFIFYFVMKTSKGSSV